MKYLLLILIGLTLSSCLTKKRAILLIDKVQEEYPELLSFDTTVVDTVYCDTVFFEFAVPCEDIIKLVPGDSIVINTVTFVKDTSGNIIAKTAVVPLPKVLVRTIRQTLKPSCPEYKESKFSIFAKWSGYAFWILLLLIIITKWKP